MTEWTEEDVQLRNNPNEFFRLGYEPGLALGTCTRGAITAQEIKTLVDHNHTGMDIWLGAGTCPEMKVVDGKLVLDFTYIDEWMADAVKAGMRPMGLPSLSTWSRKATSASFSPSMDRTLPVPDR